MTAPHLHQHISLLDDHSLPYQKQDVRDVPINRLVNYRHFQQLHQHFWARLAKEYVSELQQGQKWKQEQKHLKPGTSVVIKDDNLPPLN
ncbi:hypothetical protein Trydic_g8404 [Trypoxylus dichotomus]